MIRWLILLLVLLIVGCDHATTDHTHWDETDCAGVEGGKAELDNCGVCDAIDGYVAGACYDCADVPFGTAELMQDGDTSSLLAGACEDFED